MIFLNKFEPSINIIEGELLYCCRFQNKHEKKPCKFIFLNPGDLE